MSISPSLNSRSAPDVYKRQDYRSSDAFLSGFTLDDKLTPVITITLYLGTTQWDGPRSLAEMMPQMDERILRCV